MLPYLFQLPVALGNPWLMAVSLYPCLIFTLYESNLSSSAWAGGLDGGSANKNFIADSIEFFYKVT
jgi:hypothetical protein